MESDFLDLLSADLGLDEFAGESLHEPSRSDDDTVPVSPPLPKKKDPRNAERCKRHRQRKRDLENKVYTENAELKKEREELKKKLCQLEQEVQTLRGQGVLDFSKENALLKAEIQKHKDYVDRVVAVALGTQIEVASLETMRTIQSAIESAISQAVGLAYSSAKSPAWSKAESISMPIDDSLHELYGLTHLPDMELTYQYLPTGSSPQDALRINFRTDTVDLPVKMTELFEMYWKAMSDINIVEAHCKSSVENESCVVREVYPKTRLGVNEEMSCIAIQGTLNGKKKETVLATGMKDIKMYALAFPEMGVDSEAVSAKIAVSTCCNVVPSRVDDTEEVENLHSMSVGAAIFRDTGSGKCSLTLINSEPCTGGFHDLLLPGVPIINEDGKMHEIFIDSLRNQINSMLKMIAVQNDTDASTDLGKS